MRSVSLVRGSPMRSVSLVWELLMRQGPLARGSPMRPVSFVRGVSAWRAARGEPEERRPRRHAGSSICLAFQVSSRLPVSAFVPLARFLIDGANLFLSGRNRFGIKLVVCGYAFVQVAVLPAKHAGDVRDGMVLRPRRDLAEYVARNEFRDSLACNHSLRFRRTTRTSKRACRLPTIRVASLKPLGDC